MLLACIASSVAAPEYEQAQIVVSGESITVAFSAELVSGSATDGFTWTGGAILSGSYTGNTLTLVVAPVVSGQPGGTLAYDSGTGSLSGSGGPVPSFSSGVTNNSTFAGTWTAVGTTASWIASSTTKFSASAFSANDFAYIEDGSDIVSARRFNGSTWGSLGSSLSVLGAIQAPAICWMGGTNFAIFNGATGNAWLRTISFDGSSWSLVGSTLTLSGVNTGSALCALSSTRVVLVEASSDTIQAYDWNSGAGTWSAFGTPISVAGNAQVRITALSSTLVAYADTTGNTVALYSLSGSTWSLVSNSTISVGGGSSNEIAVCAMNATDIALCADDNTVKVYRWSGSAWAVQGTTYTVPGTVTGGKTEAVHMGANVIAFMKAASSNTFLTRLVWE